MKQIVKKPSFTSLLPLAAVIVMGVAFDHPGTRVAPALPTPQASSEVTVESTPAASDSSPAPSRASNTTSMAAIAPKQQEIKQSITTEYIYRMFTAPNDPAYSGNWALAKVNAPGAWDTATGNGQTVVAVIDSGFALNHEDLASQWQVNTGESGTTQPGDWCWTGTPLLKQSNNCDDDANGYTDDWRGWNFVSGDNNPQTGRVNPSGEGVRHGTQVAGIVGATGNNGTGIAAINWNTKVMPLQALDDNGLGYTSNVAAAIYYAVDNGAQVINLSLGSYSDDPVVKAAVDYASAHSVVIVAAAGNCGDSAGSECAGQPAGAIAYPAAHPAVIAVGATTQADQRANFGSYGPALDVSAPGYAVPASTSWSAANQTSLYSGALYGTSFASPQVASLAALIKSIRPASSVADITALIDATATKPADMGGLAYTPQFGHGVINAGSALAITQLLNTSSPTPTLLQTGSYKAEHTAPANTALASGCAAATNTACTVQFTDSSGYVRYLPYTLTSAQAGWSWSSNMLSAGVWEIRARSGDSVSTTPYVLFKQG